MSSRNGFTYETAQELFAKTRNKEAGKPLENNTRLLQRDEDFVVRLHETDVVTLHPDNTFTLQTGGWQTVTTKDRICRFSPARINAEKGFWWLAISGDWKQKVMFEEGMRVNEEGTPLNAHPWQQESLLKKRKLMRQIVNDYIAGFMQHYAGKGFPMQNEQAFDFSGDCFTCQSMSSKKPAPKDISLGHIVQHMRESYYVPSLFRKAIEWRGYPDPSVIYSWAHGQLLRNEKMKDSVLERELRHFFAPLMLLLVEETSRSCPQLFVRQERRNRARRKNKTRARN